MEQVDRLFNDFNGKSLDTDGFPKDQPFQCTDVWEKFNEYVLGLGYISLNPVGGAIDIYNNFDGLGLGQWYVKIANTPDPNNIPQKGDVIVWGTGMGTFGHVAIVQSANASGFTSFDQNYGGHYCHFVSHNWAAVLGWIRPRKFIAVVAAPTGNQRTVANASGVNHRAAPSTSAAILREWAQGEVLTFKGFVHGENVSGNDIWFVGFYTGGYLWSGSFSDTGTHDLPDLTPAPTPAPIPVPPTPTPVPPTPDPTPDPSILGVINKKHPMSPIDYAPADLVSLGNGQYLRREAQEAFVKMQTKAAQDSAPLTPTSGYRSFGAQTTVYNGYVATDGQAQADTYSARPGYSEHQTGLAMDITGNGVGLDDAFKNTPQSKWLVENAYKYGFVLRYPEGKEAITGYIYEPWHYRYIGIEAATDMYTKGESTLEQYLIISGGLYEGQDPVTPPIPDPTPGKDEDYGKENNDMLKQILAMLTDLIAKIGRIFK